MLVSRHGDTVPEADAHSSPQTASVRWLWREPLQHWWPAPLPLLWGPSQPQRIQWESITTSISPPTSVCTGPGMGGGGSRVAWLGQAAAGWLDSGHWCRGLPTSSVTGRRNAAPWMTPLMSSLRLASWAGRCLIDWHIGCQTTRSVLYGMCPDRQANWITALVLFPGVCYCRKQCPLWRKESNTLAGMWLWFQSRLTSRRLDIHVTVCVRMHVRACVRACVCV